jgi:hypothetical protein
MSPGTHKIIIESILEVTADGYQTDWASARLNHSQSSIPGGFKYSLERIITDLLDPTRPTTSIGRTPETLVRDSARILEALRIEEVYEDVFRQKVRELALCSKNVTVNFIERIITADGGMGRFSNYTWGTLIRYLMFINMHSDGWIPSTIVRETRWYDHRSIVRNFFVYLERDIGHSELSRIDGSVPEFWAEKFNNEQADIHERFSNETVVEHGHTMGHLEHEPEPEPEPEPESEPMNKQSLMKLQGIIDYVSRGEKYEINEGEYIQLSQYLKDLYSQ